MSYYLNSLRANLTKALRDCEPPASPATRQAGLNKVFQSLESWKAYMEENDDDSDDDDSDDDSDVDEDGDDGEDEDNYIPDTVCYIPKVQPRNLKALVQQLAPIANALEITLYRAKIEIRRAGDVKEPSSWVYRRDEQSYVGYAGNESSDEEEYDEEDLEFNLVDEEEFRIIAIATLDGALYDGLAGSSFLQEDIIPENYEEDLGKPIRIKTSGLDEGFDDGVTMHHWYNRFALVFALRGLPTVV